MSYDHSLHVSGQTYTQVLDDNLPKLFPRI